MNEKEMILGTANFSLNYGIESKNGFSDAVNAAEILNLAVNAGIQSFDTANAYGNAQSMLGESMASETFKVTTKLSKSDCETIETIDNAVNKSLFELKRKSITNLLVHDSEILFDGVHRHIGPKLLELKSSGVVESIGLSSYNQEEILRAKMLFPEMTVFQIPENLCDRRFLNSQVLIDLKNSGNEIVVRSIFLQGLLLLENAKIPRSLNEAREVLNEIDELSTRLKISKLELCLNYAKSIPWASGIVFGVNSSQQLSEVISLTNSRRQLDFSEFPILDLMILDPRNWS